MGRVSIGQHPPPASTRTGRSAFLRWGRGGPGSSWAATAVGAVTSGSGEPDDVAAFVAAGIFDPQDPDAPGQLELLRHLVERGATLDLIKRRLDGGDELFMVATSLSHDWPVVRTVRQLA